MDFRLQLEVGIGVARADDNVHTKLPRDTHDRRIRGQEMHEKPRYASIARVCDGTLEERAANALAAMRGENGERNFGDIVHEGYMRRADERKPIVMNAKHCVVSKVDPVNVGGNGRGPKRRPETQVPIPHGQCEKVPYKRGTVALVQPLDGQAHDRACD
jgi:hypothetical protein